MAKSLRFLWILVVAASLGLGIPDAVAKKPGSPGGQGKGLMKRTQSMEMKASKKTDGVEEEVAERAEGSTGEVTEKVEEAVGEAEGSAEETVEAAKGSVDETAEEIEEGTEESSENFLDFPKGLAKQEKTPAGWSQGEKKGWEGESLPPGLLKEKGK